VTTTDLDRRPALSLDPDPLGVIGGGMLLGYARVSTREQNLHRQIDALTAAGCSRIWQKKLSGKNADRPELQDCLAFARPNDVVTVTELWRLGRNFQHLISIVSALTEPRPRPRHHQRQARRTEETAPQRRLPHQPAANRSDHATAPTEAHPTNQDLHNTRRRPARE
jgi:hypothetical protein